MAVTASPERRAEPAQWAERPLGACMAVTASPERLVLVVAGRVAMGGDAGPVIGGIAQPIVGRQSPRHDHALSRTAGDRSYPAEAAKGVEVPPPYRIATLGKQRGHHLGADARQRQQDGRIPELLRRWLVLRRRARVVR